jgi:hypothetical protein
VLASENLFVEHIWAAEMIRALERSIIVYHAADSLRDSVVAVSLAHGVKSSYTSYWADVDSQFIVDEDDLPGGATAAASPRTQSPAAVHDALRCVVDPLRSSLRVEFTVAQHCRTAQVRIRLFDLTGRQVARIHDGPMGSGRHAVDWSYASLHRSAVSGMFLVRVEIDGRSHSVPVRLF